MTDRSAVAGLVNRLRNKHEAEDKTDKEPALKPHEWRGSVKSPGRRARRIKARNSARTTNRFYRGQAQQLAEVSRRRELGAVAVLAEVERRAGVPAGGLRQQLLDDGKLPREKMFPIPEKKIKVALRNKGRRDIIGHTPIEILAAFGMDDDAVRDLYDALLEDAANEAEARRAEKRQAAQAKREAATA